MCKDLTQIWCVEMCRNVLKCSIRLFCIAFHFWCHCCALLIPLPCHVQEAKTFLRNEHSAMAWSGYAQGHWENTGIAEGFMGQGPDKEWTYRFEAWNSEVGLEVLGFAMPNLCCNKQTSGKLMAKWQNMAHSTQKHSRLRAQGWRRVKIVVCNLKTRSWYMWNGEIKSNKHTSTPDVFCRVPTLGHSGLLG